MHQTHSLLTPRLVFTLLLTLWGLITSQSAQALPSFARQTGMACTACHTQSFGPNLNSYGRSFKLNGYTWGGNESLLSRLGGMAMGSFTNTKKDNPDLGNRDADPAGANRGFNKNNNLAMDEASVFYGGRVYEKMGAFVQLTYDGVGSAFALDNTDIRIADESDWLGQNFVYGVSFNNNPTVQDLWNTSSAWGFPYVGSPLANGPSAGPAISAFETQLGGATLYTMIDDVLFLEAGAYTNFAKSVQKGMGYRDTIKIDGGAPYWRIALQKEWQGHYVSLGHFGFRVNNLPTPDATTSDRYTDLGMDFNYQYLANPKHIYEFKASYIREQQELFASHPGSANFFNQQQDFLGLNAMYTYDQTYGISFGFNRNSGNRDTAWNLYNDYSNGKPNSEYFTTELDYIPFGKTAGSNPATYLNLRFAAQYVAYTKLDGADKNYAGPGTSGSDNNTLYFNTWLSF